MSRYRGNADKCPHCGMAYGRFRTGLKYHDIFQMFWAHSPDSGEWKYKRRNTILGKWHQVKKELWERHVDVECEQIVPF